VGQFVRQAAQDKLREAVSQAAESVNPQEPSDLPPPGCPLACLFALNIEAGGLVDMTQDRTSIRGASFVEHRGDLNGQALVIAESGVGAEAAARATEDLIDLHAPQWIVSAGFAGSLNVDLRRGAILMANEVVKPSGESLDIRLRMDRAAIEATPGLFVGRLLTVDRVIAQPDEKRRLGDETGSLACDMETFAVAEVCQRRKVKFLSVRIVSDGIDESIPPEIDKLLQQDSLVAKIGAATGAVFNRPSSVKDMWALKEQALKATDRLAKFLVGVFPQLPVEATGAAAGDAEPPDGDERETATEKTADANSEERTE
jgi:adenosylhomocysteine nucleosidase